MGQYPENHNLPHSVAWLVMMFVTESLWQITETLMVFAELVHRGWSDLVGHSGREVLSD